MANEPLFLSIVQDIIVSLLYCVGSDATQVTLDHRRYLWFGIRDYWNVSSLVVP